MHRGLVLGLVGLLAIAVSMLSGACKLDSTQEDIEAYLCFTPANASLQVGDSVNLRVTFQPDPDMDAHRKLNEEDGWQWVWDSEDGGEIEFSQVELHWTDMSGGMYMADVSCTAKAVGNVSVDVGQPAGKPGFEFFSNVSCRRSCAITITSYLPW